MESINIIVLPEVWEYIESLPVTLVGSGYKINTDYANKYVDELVDFIYKIPYSPSYKILPQFEFHFQRYGTNLQYAFFKRGNTTWYFFYQRVGNTILVRHISNNWIDGHYIR